MPIMFFDKDGTNHGHINSAYPAPDDLLQRLKETPQKRLHDDGAEEILKAVDVPPLDAEWWWLPPGAALPVPKPPIDLHVSKAEVVADERDVAVLKGVPGGATVMIIGENTGTFTADGKDIHIAFAEPGTHDIRIVAKGMRPHRLEIKSKAADPDAKPPKRAKGRLSAQQVTVGLPPEMYAAAVSPEIDSVFDIAAAQHATALPMAGEAQAYLDGKGSERIERLAAAQGSEPRMTAMAILQSVESYWETQERRAHTKREIREAAQRGGKRSEMHAILKKQGIDLGRARGVQNADIAVSKTSGGQA